MKKHILPLTCENKIDDIELLADCYFELLETGTIEEGWRQ